MTDSTGAPDLDRAVEAFRLGPPLEPPRPVGQAFSNEVWRVRTASGTYAVKLFSSNLTPARRRRLATGVGYEREVLAAGTVPIPRPVPAGLDWLIELPTSGASVFPAVSPAGARLARCHAWVEGEPATDGLPPEAVRSAGRYLAALHGMRRPGGDTADLPPLDLDRFRRVAVAAGRAGLGWADRLTGLAPTVESLAADLDRLRAERRPMRISHRDYDPKNAVLEPTGRLVIADWDYAGPVLAEAELVVGATSFGRTEGEVVAFVEAYRHAGGDAPLPDPLAMTAELADLDWLLRNVEACLERRPEAPPEDPTAVAPADPTADPTADPYAVAGALIDDLPAEIADARAWPARLPDLVGACP